MDESYVSCPYNSNHTIKRNRMAYHLIKCRKVHRHLDFKICPFNALHHYPMELEIYHLSNCEYRIPLVNTNFLTGLSQSGNLSVPPPLPIMKEGNKDWDEQ